MKKQKKPLFFRFIYSIVRKVYSKFEVEIKGKIDEQGNIYVSNHANLHGPLSLYFYFPFENRIWVIGQMCEYKEAAAYAMDDFWRHKSKATKWLYWLFSKIIVAPLAPYLFKHANTIPVYKDTRLRKTFYKTIDALSNNEDIIIFPEGRRKHNRFLNDFQPYFIDVAKHYYKKTNKRIKFYPVYTCPDLKKTIIGKPVTFNPEADIELERKRIINYLQAEITSLAEELPRHKVTPYTNMKKKYYPYSKD